MQIHSRVGLQAAAANTFAAAAEYAHSLALRQIGSRPSKRLGDDIAVGYADAWHPSNGNKSDGVVKLNLGGVLIAASSISEFA